MLVKDNKSILKWAFLLTKKQNIRFLYFELELFQFDKWA
ncbi:hypothetical protein B4090_0156 [Bacillus licheniformis]|nr:hypothetical protein B4090_0156 [Bacillus licheniformis]